MTSLLKKIDRVPLDSLTLHPENPRRGDLPAIVESLRVNQQYEPIVVQKSTGYVLAGNHRVSAARELKWDAIDVVFVDVDDEHARRIMLSSNRTGDLGSYDDSLLLAQLDALTETSTLEGTGYTCCPPETPILMADDLSFRSLGDLNIGDRVVGWAPGWSARQAASKRSPKPRQQVLCASLVVGIANRRANIVRITMASGRTILCTPDHFWLMNQSSKVRPPRNGQINQRPMSQTYGHAREGMTLCHVASPPEQIADAELQRLAWWLGGIFDGEGSVGSVVSITQSKTANPRICDKIEEALSRLGLAFGVCLRNPGVVATYHLKGDGDECVLQKIVNFVNLALPERRDEIARRAMRARWRTPDEIVSIEPAGESDVISLTTTTGNYIAWGYASKNCDYLDELRAELDAQARAQTAEALAGSLDDVPEPPQEPRSKIGEVYELGPHTLLVGDATVREDVERLMDGDRARLLFTSPPYADLRDYEGAELSVSHLASFIATCADCADIIAVNLGLVTREHALVRYWDEYIRVAEQSGLKLLAWNVWNKEDATSIGHQGMMFPTWHEWILVFGERPVESQRILPTKHGGKTTHVGQRSREGVVRESSNALTIADLKRQGSVLTTSSEKGKHFGDHPAVFPVAVPSAYIAALTEPGDIILDPFAGSGTTLIAADVLGRECRALEIAPKYADVCVERYERLNVARANLGWSTERLATVNE